MVGSVDFRVRRMGVVVQTYLTYCVTFKILLQTLNKNTKDNWQAARVDARVRLRGDGWWCMEI